MLDPFEQLEREFGWEGGLTIRPPSAFCSLADIKEDSDEKINNHGEHVDEVNISERVNSEVIEAVNEAVDCLDDSGVCDISDVSYSDDISTDKR